MTPAERRRCVNAAADRFGGVLSRAMLLGLGIDSHVVQREVRADRWALLGRRTVAVHRGPLGADALRWRAVWEVGCGATLDGVSALQAAGMQGFVSDLIHVSVDHSCRPVPVPGVRIHRLTRSDDEAVAAGVPRVRPAIATLRAAQWAASDRQAALLLVMPVQQRLVPASRLVTAADVIRGRRRRALIRLLVHDVADGAQSLGELDFARLCRRAGLPAPDRQSVRGRLLAASIWTCGGRGSVSLSRLTASGTAGDRR